MRKLLLLAFAAILIFFRLSSATRTDSPPPIEPSGVHFVDITDSSGVHFKHISDPQKKYIVESMSGGVALFDFDNDGCLDIYFTNALTVATASESGIIAFKASARRNILMARPESPWSSQMVPRFS